MQNIDFLPERIRQQRARRRRLIRQAYLVVGCAAILATLAWVRGDRVGEARAELSGLQTRKANFERQLEVRSELEQQMADLLIKKRIDDQLGSRANVLDILAELDRLMPGSMSLTDLRLETVELPAGDAHRRQTNDSRSARAARTTSRRESKIKRMRLVLTGLAPTDVDVANFIGQLSASGLFEDVNMGYSRNATFDNRIAREFQASCHVVR